jgi:small subunit ribosomal protein S17
MQEQQTANEGHRKERVGIVVSDRMDKTVVVAVDSFRRHRIYKKVLRRTARYKAHDEANEASVGDLVRIRESRPLSRLKRWRLVEIVQRHEVAETKPVEIDQAVIEELEQRRKEQPVVESAAEPTTAEEPDQLTEVPEIEEAAEEVQAAVPADLEEVPVEKAESSEEPAEGPAEEEPKAESTRRRRRSAAAPAEGAAEPVEEAADDAAREKAE